LNRACESAGRTANGMDNSGSQRRVFSTLVSLRPVAAPRVSSGHGCVEGERSEKTVRLPRGRP
jgi:hypothetical protein